MFLGRDENEMNSVKVKTNLMGKFNGQKTKSSINPKANQNFGHSSNLLALNPKCYLGNLNLASNADKIRLEHKKKLYEFIKNSSKLKEHDKGVGLLKLIRNAYIDELKFINQGLKSNYTKNGTSVENIKQTIQQIDEVLSVDETENKSIVKNKNDISFGGKKYISSSQKSDCHAIIHTTALICAGISAAMGELCMAKADLPFLMTAEMGMFAGLIDVLDADPIAGMLHAGKHFVSGATVGMNILQGIWNVCGFGAHIAATMTTAGAGNVAVSGAVRAGNGLLSATLCESMGWAFVKDYENGKMNVVDKSLEAFAYGVFWGLDKGFDNVLDLEHHALDLKESAAKSLGADMVRNMPKGVGFFIKEANEIIQSDATNYAARGLELVIPQVAQHAIESKGNIDDKTLEDIIKGSLFSLVTKDVIGFSQKSKDDLIRDEIKPVMKTLMQDSRINSLFKQELGRRGIMEYGRIVLNEKSANELGKIYENLVPEIKNILRGLGF